MLEEVEKEECLAVVEGADKGEKTMDEIMIEDVDTDPDVTRMPAPTTPVAVPEPQPAEPVVQGKGEETQLKEEGQ